MKILLMRHCLAATVQQSGVSYDAERPLTLEGERHAETVANFLKKTNLIPSLALCTPFLRSSRTAEIIAKRLGKMTVQPSTLILPGSGVDDLLGAVSNNTHHENKWTLAVIHEPDTSYMLARLLMHQDEYPWPVLPGDIYAIDVGFEDQQCKSRLVACYSPINSEKA